MFYSVVRYTMEALQLNVCLLPPYDDTGSEAQSGPQGLEPYMNKCRAGKLI